MNRNSILESIKVIKLKLKYFLLGDVLIINFILSLSCKREEFSWGEKVGDLTYSGNVVFLGTKELSLLKEVTDNKLVFIDKTGAIGTINDMSVLVLGVSEKTPYGSLRKVTGLQTNGTELTVLTSFATLTEAIKDGTIEFHEKLLEKDFRLKSKIDGVLVAGPEKSFDGLAVTLDSLEMYREGLNYAGLNGSVGISPEFDLKIIISSNKISEIDLATTLGKIDEITFYSKTALNGENEKVAAEFIHSPVVIDSLVFVPYVLISCSFSGSISGEVVSGIRQDRMIASRMKFNGTEWSDDPLTQSCSFYYTQPLVSDNTDIKVSSGPEISLLLFGIPVQVIRSEGYLQLVANKNNSPFWTLSAGIDGYNTIKAGILGLKEDHKQIMNIPAYEVAHTNTK